MTYNNDLLEELANELARGEEVRTSDGFKTHCPCCHNKGLPLELRITEAGLFRYECHAGCKAKDIRQFLQSWGLPLLQQLSSSKGVGNHPLQFDQGFKGKVVFPIKGIMLHDLLAMDIPEPEMFLSPFLRSNSVTMIYASPGIGKTWLAHDIAVSLTHRQVNGDSLGPWKIIKGCGVMLIDGELPLFDLQQRLALLAKHLGARDQEEPLVVYSSIENSSKQGGKTIDFTQQEWRDTITEHLVSHPEYRLLVLDNRSSLTDGRAEISKKIWWPINRWLMQLRGMGLAVIIIHHANKDGEDRGIADIRGNLDNTLVLKQNSKVRGKTSIVAKFEKNRNLAPEDHEDVELTLEPFEGGGLRLV